ncbi:ribonuclease H-like domain-containing protein [Kalaharituber pfeilii]|nr:ribonuclease H-like domain-containing protein [Kalaharituber pfeilii]
MAFAGYARAIQEDEPRPHPVPTHTSHSVTPRLFSPLTSSCWRGSLDPVTLSHYEPCHHLTYLLYSPKYAPSCLIPYLKTIAVTIDGACRGNGTNQARGSWAAYFGPGSIYNRKALLRPETRQTSQVAEIVAALNTLLQIKPVLNEAEVNRGLSIVRVVLITDSEYVVRCMTEWVWKWIDNGWMSSKRQQVVNAYYLQLLHKRIEELAEEGVIVEFWHVDRRWTVEADRMANEALDELA